MNYFPELRVRGTGEQFKEGMGGQRRPPKM